MIKYALKCGQAHQFESWFGSSADFDRLRAAGLIACAVCGSDTVEKDLMAPRVGKSEPEAPTLSAPASPAEQALKELRSKIEENCDNVGDDFVAEARRIHDGDAPARGIFGKAEPQEARDLIEDGIPVTPLPFLDIKKN